MNLIRKFPATFTLLFVNVIVFIIIYLQIKTFTDPEWTLHLLNSGAEFNPFTLNGQWYRIFTHMFLHGSILHLVFNMYALYSVGTEVESELGVKKFLWVYFLSGIAAALVSLYWSLFAIGVGASGAIFGLFGFSLVTNITRSRQAGESFIPIVVNFALFLGINIYFAQAFKGDTAAHLGGLAFGIVAGIFIMIREDWFWRNNIHYAFIALFVILYFALPRYQVTYYNFFQSVLAAEDSGRQVFTKGGSDADYLLALKRNFARWDSSLLLLDNHGYVPPALHSDTFKLRRYVQLRKEESTFRIKMIELESYIYVDSVEAAQDSMQSFFKIDYALAMTMERNEKKPTPTQEPSSLQSVKILYNEDWEEVSAPPFVYYRIGSKDSLGRWQGRVTDFYANGDVQMKGAYTKNQRDGVFIYYSDHKTYTSAGRYRDDQSVGKWETYHANGKLQSEVVYTDRYFLKNLWDSAGNQVVDNGEGRVVEFSTPGIVSNEGEYHDGVKDGYWYGRHANGEMYYEENYYQGRLTRGRSRNLQNETFIYDESSFFPIPEGGYPKLRKYLDAAVDKVNIDGRGTVRLSFRVTTNGKLTDFKTIRSVSNDADSIARRILTEGPRWIPAKDHGNQSVDGFAFIDIEYN